MVDLEGEPVAGLKVRIRGLYTSKEEDLTPWIKAAKAGELPWTLYSRLEKAFYNDQLGTPTSATTDREGRYQVRGLGRERMVTMIFESETVAHQTVSVLTRDIPAFKRTIVPGTRYENFKEPVFGAEFTFTAAPARLIEGKVVDAKTKEPLAGVTVESYKLANYPTANHRVLKTTTDAGGRFRMLGMAKGDGNQLILLPNDEQPYLMREVEVPNPDGLDPAEMTVELHKGIWIKGRVTDKTTGEPVQARLYFLPYRNNKFAQAVPEFGTKVSADGDQTRYQTKPDGSYRMVGLPGPAIIGAFSFGRNYRQGVGYATIKGPKQGDTQNFYTYANPIFAHPKWPTVMTEIDTPADAESITVNLQMDPGLTAPVILVDPAGKPLDQVTVTGKSTDSQSTVVEDQRFDAVNFGPEETRTMLFHHPKRKLARVEWITPNADGKPVTVKLEPQSTLKGRLLHEDGTPITGGSLQASPQPQNGFSKHIPGRIITDAEGRFEITLYPGGPYTVNLEAAGLGKFGFATVGQKIEVEPGVTKDLGDLYHVPKDGKFQSKKKSE